MTKLALALVRPQPLPGALPGLRLAATAAAAATLAFLGYTTSAGTTLFAVENVEVVGAPPDVAAEVRAAVAPLAGTSLARLDGDGLAARLRTLPSVRAVEYDRAFPSTLRLVVHAERPVAVVRLGQAAWLVSERGRVLRAVEPGTLGHFPRVWAGPDSGVAPGDIIADGDVRLAVRALAAVPKRFPARVIAARRADAGLVVVLASRAEVRLATADSVALKLAAAGRVLAALPDEERAAVAYVDASVPDRVVVGQNSQVEG